jgi:hypothetical protein
MKSITRMLLALFIFSLVSFSSYHINTGQADTIPPSPESLMLLKKKNGEISEQAKVILELQSRMREAEDTIKSLGERPRDPMVCIRSMRSIIRSHDVCADIPTETAIDVEHKYT